MSQMSEKERNLRIAQTICEDFAWNGQTFREGDFVALLDGKIVAVARNVDDAIATLRARDPDPKRGMVIEVTHPVVDVIRWTDKSHVRFSG
jgi:hypothetical protein